MQVDFWTATVGAIAATSAGFLVGVGSVLWIAVRIYRLQVGKEQS